MKINETLHGFTVRQVKELPEHNATMYQFEYTKNGAELIWFDNGENNKLFSIAFKTLPSDDTGVFHILEHSVLCGSKKYPVKEPFVELLKSSMNTFLNAMTFPDKTIYPVSSKNETDFLNLMKVYLDAVFCPAIYENPNIFYQEGWHYELNAPEEEPIYKGVVFNEMKGAFSSADTLLINGMNRLLFPDNCYRFVSGGDPAKIPTLTYEQFLSAHREYYHPSNAKIYLDGKVPLENVLRILDEEYLSKYDKSDVKHEIALQMPAPASGAVEYYAIGEEDQEEMVQMALGKIVCDFSDRKRIMALMVLSSYLTDSNEAPLKYAILQNGLAQDVFLSVVDSISQPYFVLQINNTEYERRNAIKETLRKTVENLLREGLNRDELEAVINRMEFRIREGGEPQGLMRNMSVLNAWLYGGEIDMYLKNDELFQQLRGAMDTDYYETLLKDILLDEEHMAEMYLLPSQTKDEEERQAECERLAEKKASWSAKDLEAVLSLNRKLQEWQCLSDSPEALATLPVLSIDEVNPVPDRLATEHTTVGNTPVLFHKVKEAGVVHFNLYFSLADCPFEKTGDISFMTNLFGMLPTKRHSVLELQREIKRNIGLLDYNIVSFPVPNQRECCKPYFTVNCSVLKNKMSEAVRLITEILTETVFDSEQSTLLIREILKQCNEGMRRDITENGSSFAMKRALSYGSADAMFMEHGEGVELYRRIHRLNEEFESLISDFQTYARSVQETVFSTARMTLSVTSDEICREFLVLIENLKKENVSPAAEFMTVSLKEEQVREMIQIPAGISYAVSAGHLDCYGVRYSGSLRVLATILSYDYLWNKVRVQGGAYGCGFQVRMTGNMGFHSFRDPNPLNSVDVYRQAAEFVRTFCESDASIEKYIISTIAATEPLVTLREQGLFADTDEQNGISFEDTVRIRREMLQTKKEDLLKYCDLFEAMAKENHLCIIGNSDIAKQCDDDWKVFNL